jgi:cytochrome c-type biogenesis protein CcmH/NrfF
MSLEAAFWLFFMLPLITTLIGGVVWEAIKTAHLEAQHNRQRVRDLHQQNHELRDEIARLKQQR